eukprot:CAMPEP_0173161904 /NCGR_PEP_ID=MMETSP1105-20130129/18906_1 /TAXON_ID=2985 /ORGANISM="Ochromonas sp., Strain BG-1" /LENGTH=476 /DNA_ID=CAMNT_0014081465 /DNA_START=8 /DNA_END=1438 /DNA_ORIENTATION=-
MLFRTLVFLTLMLNFPKVWAEEEERPASMFKVGDEWLALPEVFSNLDFSADSSWAKDDDIEGQLRLRSTRFWGRLYIDGWPQTIQYFRAHFGIEPPVGRKTFVFADPRDACTELNNAHLLTKDHVLLVNRGTCTFGTKAKIAERSNASAVIIINNEPGIDHLPGPDAHDIQYSISSIAQQEGQLLESIYDEGPADDTEFGRKLEGYIVPINCAKTGTKCGPATVEERTALTNLIEGGEVLIYRDGETTPLHDKKDYPVEYLLAHFGTKVLHQNVSIPITVAKPAEACTPLENDVRGKAVLVRRGGCPFVKKAEEIQAAGGRVMIVGNQYSYIVRMGVEPRWKGLNTVIPVIMISKRAYSILVAESYAGSKIAFKEDEGIEVDPSLHNGISRKKTINGEVWENIEKLHKGEGWPRSDLYVQKRYDELIQEHEAWPDRVIALNEAFQSRMKEVNRKAKQQNHQQHEQGHEHDSLKSDL